MPKDANLLVAVPTLGSIHPSLAARLILWGQRHGAKISFYFTFNVSPVDRARNKVVAFLLNGTFTHLLMVDSDTIPPEDAIERLFSHEKQIVTGLTPIVSYDKKSGHWQTYDNAFVERERDEDGKVTKTHIAARRSGLKEVFRCGASCILIAREVFESLEAPYFRFIPNQDNTEHVRSEDIDFCDRATANGFPIYADTDVVCQHYKNIMI